MKAEEFSELGKTPTEIPQENYGPGWINTVAVYCGSRLGNNPKFKEHGHDLAYKIIENDWNLVYGGGTSGLMGVVRDGAELAQYQLEKDPSDVKIIGINPSFFFGHQGESGGNVHEETVQNMFQRKARFLELAQVHDCLSGGFGTADEFFEVLTAADLTPINRPNFPVPHLVLIDTDEFYTRSLMPYLRYMVEQGLAMQDRIDSIVHLASDPDHAIQIKQMLNSAPPMLGRDFKKKGDGTTPNMELFGPQLPGFDWTRKP